MNKRQLIVLCLLAAGGVMQAQQWPNTPVETRPGARWWWLGSAVDEKNLTYNLEEYARTGMGAVEITPIYGVQGNDANEIQFLSPRWMEMLKHTQAEGKRTGIEIDMNTGTGWPFGGPEVSIEDAATKAIFQTYEIFLCVIYSGIYSKLTTNPRINEIYFIENIFGGYILSKQ